MFWHHFSPESIKTHSETILSLYETDGKGNADKKPFCTVKYSNLGHLRSKKVKQGHFRLKGVGNDEKGLKSIIEGWNIHQIFRIPFKILITSSSLRSTFRSLTDRFRGIYCISKR